MKPTNSNILFKPFPSDEFINGIYVPESVREVNDKGVIWAAGAKAKLEVGTVCHRVHKWGQEVLIKDELYFLMDEKAIIAVE